MMVLCSLATTAKAGMEYRHHTAYFIPLYSLLSFVHKLQSAHVCIPQHHGWWKLRRFVKAAVLALALQAAP